MQPARLRADFFRHGRGKGNHIMPHLGLNFIDSFQVKVAALGNRPRRVFRDNPRIGQGKAGGSFNL